MSPSLPPVTRRTCTTISHVTLYTNNITAIYHLYIIVIDKVTTSMVPSSSVQLGQVSDTSLSVVPHYTVPGRVVSTSDHNSVVTIILYGAGTTVIIIIVNTSHYSTLQCTILSTYFVSYCRSNVCSTVPSYLTSTDVVLLTLS